jgi:Antitoxin Phd_YefM, type II toxin-antitoxin system
VGLDLVAEGGGQRRGPHALPGEPAVQPAQPGVEGVEEPVAQEFGAGEHRVAGALANDRASAVVSVRNWSRVWPVRRCSVITRNGRPEAVIMACQAWRRSRRTLDLLSTSGALEQIRQAEADIAAGKAVDADELRRQLAAREERESRADQAHRLSLPPAARRALTEAPPVGLPPAVASARGRVRHRCPA